MIRLKSDQSAKFDFKALNLIGVSKNFHVCKINIVNHNLQKFFNANVDLSHLEKILNIIL